MKNFLYFCKVNDIYYMNTKINKVKNSVLDTHQKIIKVTKTDYTLDNGDVYEHTFDIDENITVDEFQTLLDNAKNIIVETLTKIENNKL